MCQRHLCATLGLTFALAAAGPLRAAGQEGDLKGLFRGEVSPLKDGVRVRWEFASERELEDWTWRNLTGRSSADVSGGRVAMSVPPKADLWSRDGRGAPMLSMKAPVVGDFELRATCAVRGKGPHSAGLVVWAGRERVSRFLLLCLAKDGGSTYVGVEGCCSLNDGYKSPRINAADGPVELRITRTGRRYRGSFRPARASAWQDVASPEVADELQYVGLYGKTWGGNSAVATFGKVTFEGKVDAKAIQPTAGDSAGHTDVVRCVCFSPDGRRVASASLDRTVRLWDAATGKLERTLTGHAGAVFWVAFSPDGKTLASGGADKTVRLWDAHTGALKQTLAAHAGRSWAGAFAPKGSVLASGSEDGTVTLWKGQARDAVTLRGRGAGNCAAFSPDGRLLACGDGRRQVVLFDVASGKPQHVLTHGGWVCSVAFFPDGRRLAVGCADRRAYVWDVASGTLVRTIKERFGAVQAVAVSPDGQTLAGGGGDYLVRLWDARTGQAKGVLSEHRAAAWSVAFSPNGRLLASGGEDARVVVRDWRPPELAVAKLPKQIDLRPRMERWGLVVQGQRRRPTCSVHTFTRALEFGRSMELGQGVPLSDEFANWASNQVIRNVGPSAKSRGQFFSHLWMGYRRHGACAERHMPFTLEFDPSRQPSADALKDAAGMQTSRLRWQHVCGTSEADAIRKAKAVLAMGWPLMAGSHHSVLIVGYTDNEEDPGGGHFTTMDSGANGGKGAYGSIPYSRVRDYGLCWISVRRTSARPQRSGWRSP